MKILRYFILLGALISTYTISAVTYNIKNNTAQPIEISMHTIGSFGSSCTTHHRNETAQGAWIPIPSGELASPPITPGGNCVGNYIYYNSPTSAKYYLQKPSSSSTITISYISLPGASEKIWSITETTTDGHSTKTVCDPTSNDCGLPVLSSPSSAAA